MKTLKKALPYAVAFTLPMFAFAQNAGQVSGIINNVQGVLTSIIPILLLIATIVFLWGVIQFITAGADEEKRASARSLMIYGLIALFVMVAVWGIVQIMVQFTGTGNVGIPTSPGQIQ